MKTFQTDAEIAAGGLLILRELPFAAGERVAVTITSPAPQEAMRSYAERMAENSADFLRETQDHVTERLLRETEW
jgi:hypothetical protein